MSEEVLNISEAATIEAPEVEHEAKTDEAVAQPDEVKAEGEETEKSDEEETPKSRKDKRIDQITRQKGDLQRALESEQRKTALLESKLAEASGIKKDLIEHDLDNSSAAIESINRDIWAAKVEEAKIRLPDYDEVVYTSKIHMEDHVARAAFESDVGPEIFHYLAKNPAAVEKLNGMTDRQALKEIGRLESIFETKVQTAPSKKVSEAPAPVKPVSSSKSVVNKDPAGMTQAEYEDYRRKQGARW